MPTPVTPLRGACSPARTLDALDDSLYHLLHELRLYAGLADAGSRGALATLPLETLGVALAAMADRLEHAQRQAHAVRAALRPRQPDPVPQYRIEPDLVRQVAKRFAGSPPPAPAPVPASRRRLRVPAAATPMRRPQLDNGEVH